MRCTTVVLSLLQVAYIQEYINSINDRWLDEKDVMIAINSIKLGSSNTMDLLRHIPESIQLDPQLVPLAAFYNSIKNDNDNFQRLGSLVVENFELSDKKRAAIREVINERFVTGMKKRMDFYESFISEQKGE